MPIDYKQYHPKWKLIRRLILKRANNKCEWCGLHNHSYGYRDPKTKKLTVVDNTIENQIDIKLRGLKLIRIILTIAHIDRDKNNNLFGNLAALCQRCHLLHDKDQHSQSRRFGKNWKQDQTKMNL